MGDSQRSGLLWMPPMHTGRHSLTLGLWHLPVSLGLTSWQLPLVHCTSVTKLWKWGLMFNRPVKHAFSTSKCSCSPVSTLTTSAPDTWFLQDSLESPLRGRLPCALCVASTPLTLRLTLRHSWWFVITWHLLIYRNTHRAGNCVPAGLSGLAQYLGRM